MIRNLSSINAYPEFRTDAGIDMVRTAVQTNTVPANLNNEQANRFTQKFLNGEWEVSFLHHTRRGNANHPNQRLKYVPPSTNPPINLLVSYPDERQVFMNRVFSDKRRGYGVGLQSFYHQISLSHLNIQKRYTDDFLRGKGDYQIQKQPVRKINRPIKTRRSNERWGIDMIHMTVGNAHRYIFTCVDYFSGYLWTRKTTQVTKEAISDALRDVIQSNMPHGANGNAPDIIQSDNGGEFVNDLMDDLMDEYDITHIKTTSYHPKANGKVERKNREVRKKIKSIFIRQNQNSWTLGDLRDVTANINSQVTQKSKLRPIDLYQPNAPAAVNPLQANVTLQNDNTRDQLNTINRHYQNARAVGLIDDDAQRFQVGDLVRIAMYNLSSRYREVIKSKMGINKLAVHYSPAVCRVLQVFHPNQNRYKFEYSLTAGTNNGLPPPANQIAPLRRGNVPHLFTGDQLVPAGDRVSLVLRDTARADRMNSRN